MTTKIIAALIALTIAFGLSACGGSSNTTAQSACVQHASKFLSPAEVKRECASIKAEPTEPTSTQAVQPTQEEQIAQQTKEAEARRQHLQEQAGIPTK